MPDFTDYTTEVNRPLQDRPFKPSTIGTIDEAVFRHIDEAFNLFITSAAGREKVPVIWQTAERTFQIKNNLERRDSSGKLILPLIAVTRDSIEKDPSFKGKVQAHIYEPNNAQGGALLVSRKILQRETTKHQVSQNLKSERGDKFYPIAAGKVIYEETYMPVPVYVKVMYTINLRTEYLSQMNELMSPFLAKTGQIWAFTIVHEGHRYETFIEQTITDNKNSSNLGQEERKFEAQVKLKVLGYLTTEGENRSRPHYAKRETTSTIVVREYTVAEIPSTGGGGGPPPGDPTDPTDPNDTNGTNPLNADGVPAFGHVYTIDMNMHENQNFVPEEFTTAATAKEIEDFEKDPTITEVSVFDYNSGVDTGITNTSLLVCTHNAADENSDPLTITFKWTNSNGSTYSSTTNTLQLTAGNATAGQEVTCEVTADDGNGTPAVLSDTVTIV